MDEIKIYDYKKMDLRDAVVVEGFPSVGLVSTIVANYIVTVLNLDLLGVMDSPFFPTVSVIRGGEPFSPVRFYGGDIEPGRRDSKKIVVFLSEFQPPSTLIKGITTTLLDWAQDNRCAYLISPEGLIVERPEGSEVKEKLLFAIGSTEHVKETIQANGIPIFQEGLISGIPGVLLNEGKRRNFDVFCILSETHENLPDARAAARIIEVMNALIPEMGLDPAPLYKEASVLEERMKEYQKMSKPGGKRTTTPLPSMYG